VTAAFAPRQAATWAIGVAAVLFAGNLFEDRYLFWDSYLDLAAGRVIANDGIPHREVFTVAAREHNWIDQQWLAHLITYASWSVGGYPAVAAVSSLAVAAAFGLLCAMMITRGVHPQRAVMWTAGAFAVCLGNTVIRAQAFAFPLFVLLVWGIVDDAGQPRLRRRSLMVLPLLVVWANVHGSVLLAVLLVVATAIVRCVCRYRDGQPITAYLALAAVSPLCVFANPYGFSVIHYYAALIGNPVVSTYILEWAPPSFGNPFSLAFIVLLLATCGVMGFVTAKGARPGAVPMLLLTLTGAVASQGVRYATWFGLTAAAINAEALASVGRSPYPLPGRVVRLAGGVTAVVVALSLFTLTRTTDHQFERLQPDKAMAAAAAYASTHPGVDILADDTSSSAMLWKYPTLYGRIGFDARLEQFSRPELKRWFEWMTMTGGDWLSVTRPYDVLVVSRHDHPDLARTLLRTRGWRAIENDSDGVALIRSRP
jgi:hypothetical protein